MSPPQLTHAKDFCCCCCCLFFVAVVVVVFTDHGTALFWYWTRYTYMTGLIQHVVWSSTWSDPAHAWMMQPGNIHQPVYTHANKWKSIRKNFDMGHWWGGGGGSWSESCKLPAKLSQKLLTTQSASVSVRKQTLFVKMYLTHFLR